MTEKSRASLLSARAPRATLIAEAEKQRRVPGIVFADDVTGRTARVAGTGLEVFEVIQTYRAVGNDRDRLHEAYHWLSDAQIGAALEYAAAYPEEIDQRLKLEEALERRYSAKPPTR